MSKVGEYNIAAWSFNLLGDSIEILPSASIIKYRRRLRYGGKVKLDIFCQDEPITRVFEMSPIVDRIHYGKAERKYFMGVEGYEEKLIYNITQAAKAGMNTPIGLYDALHMSAAYGVTVGLEPTDCLWVPPVLKPLQSYEEKAKAYLKEKLNNELYIVISPHSKSSTGSLIGGGNKLWPTKYWENLVEIIKDQLRLKVVIVGAEGEEHLVEEEGGIINLYGEDIRFIGSLLNHSALLITIDNGIAHLGVGLMIWMVELLHSATSYGWVTPEANPNAGIIYHRKKSMKEMSPKEVEKAVKAMLSARYQITIGDLEGGMLNEHVSRGH